MGDHGKKLWFATYGFLQAEGSIFDAMPAFGSFVPDLSGLSELPSVLEDTRVPQARPIPTPKKTKPPPWRGAGCSDGPVRTGITTFLQQIVNHQKIKAHFDHSE